jgi:Ca2+-binding RTX toxin-like protein
MKRITTEVSNFSGSHSTPNDYGDYEGADSAAGLFFPAWSDNRASHGGDTELYMLTAPVEAPEVTKFGSALIYHANARERNTVTISLASGTYTVNDTTSTAVAGGGCTQVTPNKATCSATGVTQIIAQAGDFNDTLTLTAPTSAGLLDGGPGRDTLNGGPLNDKLDGGTGPDDMFGGGGTDTVTYASRGLAVTVDIDNAGDDGSSSDADIFGRDNVHTDLENLIGGAGNDTLLGSAATNALTGGGGADTMRGYDGNDILFANDGIVDALLNCDGGFSPGSTDVAHVNAGDPNPANCETVGP